MQSNQLIIQYKRLLEQQSASVDALLSELNDNSKPPFKIAKDMKGLFILIFWAMYQKGVFVTADSPEDDEKKAESFKKVMTEYGSLFGEEFKNPEALLDYMLDKDNCIDGMYDLIGIISKRREEKKRDYEAKNRAKSNAEEKEKCMFKDLKG